MEDGASAGRERSCSVVGVDCTVASACLSRPPLLLVCSDGSSERCSECTQRQERLCTRMAWQLSRRGWHRASCPDKTASRLERKVRDASRSPSRISVVHLGTCRDCGGPLVPGTRISQSRPCPPNALGRVREMAGGGGSLRASKSQQIRRGRVRPEGRTAPTRTRFVQASHAAPAAFGAAGLGRCPWLQSRPMISTCRSKQGYPEFPTFMTRGNGAQTVQCAERRRT
ncbi:hypothetical protein C8Q76DRAFT_212863 [Earliella scabrosa]|nr:hypothetical protein C8Q76DRAFT_212863 [Earliella scabrosa]